MGITEWWRGLRADRGLRRADREHRAALHRSLAGWSAAQRRDLLATLDRYPDDVTQDLRETLARPAPAPLQGGWSLRRVR